MLLEVNCSVNHFIDFLGKAEDQGVRPDFRMHGADEESSFTAVPSDNFSNENDDIENEENI